MADRRPRAAERMAALSDADLVAAVRREDGAAIAELYRRFAPMLRRRAASWRGAGAACDDLVDDVLADVALALMRPGGAAPRSLAAYLLVSLRHRLARERRAEARRRLEELDAATVERPPSPGGRGAQGWRVAEPALAVVHASVSAHARRAARLSGDGDGAGEEGGDGAPLHPALARLAAELDAGLREPDRLLLAWLADHVPMRTAAAWLGIGYDAALKRASRLRARLRLAALAHADALPPAERRVVHAFLGRALGDAAVAPPPAERSP